MLGPILQWVNKIYQRVDTTISSRASQSSVDAIPTQIVKNVQHGESQDSDGISDGQSSWSWTQAISSVNTSKSMLLFFYSKSGHNDTSQLKHPYIVRGEFNSSSELYFSIEFEGAADGYSGGGAPSIRYQVIEFE